MLKKTVDYRDCVTEAVCAVGDGRVLLGSRGREGKPNVMTIGWGTVGVIWGRPIFVVLVRPSRHTYRLIEESGEFTVNVLPDSLKDIAAYCGSVSGRDHDKIREKGLSPSTGEHVQAPLLGEAVIQFECRVVHKNDVLPLELAKPIKEGCYAGGDFHRIYFGEILACRRDA